MCPFHSHPLTSQPTMFIAAPVGGGFSAPPLVLLTSGVRQIPYGARPYRARTARHLRNRAFLGSPSLPLVKTDQDFQPSKGMTPHAGFEDPVARICCLYNTPRPAKVGR